ncbi:hypothetical protein F0562_008335 [Nyssa sinensis]|uniref:Uncharacterized protein n=1 Tax=Nyssa sinensis TaxID=561372 RepID=A0A5J5A992_9ASTE|nr:hypothetical protein F0562_008335 [Nyssa sinensis]
MTRRFLCSATTQTNHPTAARGLANFQPSIWSHDFLESLKSDHIGEIYKKRAKKLEEEVRNMIEDEDAEPLTVLELIDDIQRLGLGYLFEKSITRALDKVTSSEESKKRIGESIHASSVYFRLLRQQGYKVSADLFKKFKDREGNFKTCTSEDVKGMLSLYEASYLAFEGENILDEAKVFTSMHLKEKVDSSMAEQVSHAMELPLHHRVQRLEARWYIEAYGKRKDANRLLLELSKLDFNMVQSTLQRDLQDMSRWWRDVGLANKLSFSRDRLVESFFWAVGMVFEPRFGKCRKGLTKVFALVTTIDDVYDVYGSLDELQLFTEAVDRWDINAVKHLPDYMKLCFLALYNTVNNMAYDTLKEQEKFVIPYLAKAWADLCKAFLQEANWNSSRSIPTLEDYLDNARISVSGVLQLVHAYFLASENVEKEALKCLENYHDLLHWPSVIFRLCNDLSTSSAELERGETANAISCYMHETGQSEELAREHISNMIDETWKKINKEVASASPFEKSFINIAINLARISRCTYQYGDGHGAPDVRAKNRVQSVIVNPISLT